MHLFHKRAIFRIQYTCWIHTNAHGKYSKDIIVPWHLRYSAIINAIELTKQSAFAKKAQNQRGRERERGKKHTSLFIICFCLFDFVCLVCSTHVCIRCLDAPTKFWIENYVKCNIQMQANARKSAESNRSPFSSVCFCLSLARFSFLCLSLVLTFLFVVIIFPHAHSRNRLSSDCVRVYFVCVCLSLCAQIWLKNRHKCLCYCMDPYLCVRLRNRRIISPKWNEKKLKVQFV